MEPVLVLDQAFEYLLEEGNPKSTTPAAITAIEQLSHHTHKVIVFLSLAERAFLRATHDVQQGYRRHTLDLQKVIDKVCIREMPPNSMWKLPTNDKYEKDITIGSHCSGKRVKKGNMMVGMGPNLARLFMSAYGGQFLQIHRAIGNLLFLREDSRIGDHFLGAAVDRCLRDGNYDGKYDMASLLENMAIQGYAPFFGWDLPHNNPDARMICEEGIGGIFDTH